MALAAANAATLAGVSNQMACERTSRENWQNRHAPTISQYVDVQTSAGAGAGANALSNAEALAILNQSNGIIIDRERMTRLCLQMARAWLNDPDKGDRNIRWYLQL